MSYSIYVRRAAERDAAKAQKWYEEQQPGLAAQFNIEFNATLDRLAKTPLFIPPGTVTCAEPYCSDSRSLVWYRIQNSRVTVLACTHGKADPNKLPPRLDVT